MQWNAFIKSNTFFKFYIYSKPSMKKSSKESYEKNTSYTINKIIPQRNTSSAIKL